MNWDWLRLEHCSWWRCSGFLIILAEPDSVLFLVTISPWALSLLLAVNFRLLTSMWLTSWESHQLTWEHQFVYLESTLAGTRTHVQTDIPSRGPLLSVNPWCRACHPLAPDMAQLLTGPAPHSGPASQGKVRTLIHGIGRESATDKPSPPIAGLQSYATMTDMYFSMSQGCRGSIAKRTKIGTFFGN